MQVRYIIWLHVSVTWAGAGCVWLLARRMLLSFISVGWSRSAKRKPMQTHRENLQVPTGPRHRNWTHSPSSYVVTVLTTAPLCHLVWTIWCEMRLIEDTLHTLTRDLELCLVGGRNCRTLVGVSFSMECLLWGVWRRSGWGVEDMGRNMGGAVEEGKKTKMNLTCKS